MEREFDLEPGEAVIKEVRMHWFFFLGQLLPLALLAALPFLLPWLLSFGGTALSKITWDWSAPAARAALGLWWLIIWSSAFNLFTRYFLNAWIITNQRIVELEQRGFFNREVSSLLLNRIQDITINTQGLFHSLLNIGDINVQTAGTVDRFTMDNVPHPAMLRDSILQSAQMSGRAAGV